MLQKLLQWEGTVLLIRVKGVGLTLCGEQIIFLIRYVFISGAAGQFLGVLNTYCFSFHSLPSASRAERIKPHYAWKPDLSISSVACSYYLLLKIED